MLPVGAELFDEDRQTRTNGHDGTIIYFSQRRERN